MEEAARRYARWVLTVHVILLAGVLILVYAATRETYQRARAQVLAQARQRQELLAGQTAQAIQEHYSAILANLHLIKRMEEAEAAAGRGTLAGPADDSNAGSSAGHRFNERLPALRMATTLWSQLEGRAEQLFVVRRHDMQVGFALPPGSRPQAEAILDYARPWLLTVSKPVVSDFFRLGSGGANLVAVPFFEDYLIVAVVPIQVIEQRFLDAVNREATMSASLLDAAGHTMATSDQALVGGNVYRDLHDPPALRLLEAYMAHPRMTTAQLEEPLEVGQTVLPPRMVTAVPIFLDQPSEMGATGTAMNPRPWTLLVASHLSEVDAIVRTSFGRALVWAVLVGLTLTVILVSTAIQMIRARVRLENLRNEALRRELEQARQIQLAWLPAGRREQRPIRIAAVNQAANHISGDFYDWFDLPDGRTVITIGDVTGHGMSAAFLMATTQLLVRNTMLRVLDPGACLSEVNRQLCNQVFNGQFVTLLIVAIDPQGSPRLEAATAGHFPPLVSDGNGFYPLKMKPHLVLGIEPDEQFPTERFDLPETASLLLYTDGVPDAANPAGERFGVDNLLTALAADQPEPAACIDRVLEAIARFRADRDIVDDLTMVAVRVEAAAVPIPATAEAAQI